MTKHDIVLDIVAKTGFQQAEVKVAVQRTFDLVIKALETERRIELRGFGIFNVRLRKARSARNPATGEPVDVPAKLVVVLKPGKEVIERVQALAGEDLRSPLD